MDDRAMDLVGSVFQKVWLRGDTDFSLTSNFDRWDEKVGFVFGYDSKKNLVDMADALVLRENSLPIDFIGFLGS